MSADLGSNHPQYENLVSENTLKTQKEHRMFFLEGQTFKLSGGLECGNARKKTAFQAVGQKRKKKAFFF